MNNQFIPTVLLLALSYALTAQRVANVRLEQQGEVAVVRYDILDAREGDNFGVKMLASSDRSASWRLPVTKLSGDVGNCDNGRYVSPGRDKTIQWQLLVDMPEFKLQRTPLQVKIQLDHCNKAATDADADGVSDKFDDCPTVFGKLPNGCPANEQATNAPPNGSYTETVNGVTFNMIFVKGGSFKMGCTDQKNGGCNPDENPAHNAGLSDYFIGETEVTQALWKSVMGSSPSRFKDCDDCPIENISWADVQDFLHKLNRLTGKNYRLPTEAEWEFAARGGRQGKDRAYSGSNELLKVGWFSGNSNRPYDVKRKLANELGLFDMSGNVWEWCLDWYGLYEERSQKNPMGRDTGKERVIRGGSWNSTAQECRVTLRNKGRPDYHSNDLGFRLVTQ